MRWGVSLGNLFVINGRMEELTSKFFKRFLNKRCVVVFDGYYEWKTVGNPKDKQPYLIHPKKGEEESKASKDKEKRQFVGACLYLPMGKKNETHYDTKEFNLRFSDPENPQELFTDTISNHSTQGSDTYSNLDESFTEEPVAD